MAGIELYSSTFSEESWDNCSVKKLCISLNVMCETWAMFWNAWFIFWVCSSFASGITSGTMFMSEPNWLGAESCFIWMILTFRTGLANELRMLFSKSKTCRWANGISVFSNEVLSCDEINILLKLSAILLSLTKIWQAFNLSLSESLPCCSMIATSIFVLLSYFSLFKHWAKPIKSMSLIIINCKLCGLGGWSIYDRKKFTISGHSEVITTLIIIF